MRKLELRKARQRQQSAPDPSVSRPRPTKLTRTGHFVRATGALLIAGSLIAGLWIHSAATSRRQLRQKIRAESATAEGTITGLSRTRGDKPRHIVMYEYAAAGGTQRGRATIRRSDWSRLSPGAGIEVRYLPSRPEQSWVAGYEPGGIPLWVAPLASLGIAFLAAICWAELTRQQRLLCEGRLAEARVTGLKKSNTGKGGRVYTVRYEFRTLSGALIRGKYNISGNPPDEGSTIRVLYDPDGPQRNSPYPLSLVRPA